MNQFVKRATQKISKLSEEQLTKLFSSLTEENEIFSAVLESLPTGILVCDCDWHLSLFNKSSERFLPLKKRLSECVTSASSFVWDIIDDAAIVNFLLEVKDLQNNASREFVVSSKDGAEKYIELNVVPLVRKKKVVGNIIRIDNITEKRNQEILLHRVENLASLTNLAASVAHEIKNPLAGISIHIQLVQKAIAKARTSDNCLPEERFLEKHLDVATDEIERLNKIIVDFLFAVRPISANLEMKFVSEIIESIAKFAECELNHFGISLELDLIKDEPQLLIDEKLLKQVFINLIQNAKAAMKSGGKIIISTKVRADKMFIAIADNGSGIEKDVVNRIFEPYFTTKANGTGLGLTMVYKMIKEMAGDIDVKSEVKKGTIFTIAFPIPQKECHLIEYRKEK